MKQYIHLIDGKLMVGGEKPIIPSSNENYGTTKVDSDRLIESQKALTAWRESLVEVKNPEFFDSEENRGRTRYDGQQVQTSEPGRITKIL